MIETAGMGGLVTGKGSVEKSPDGLLGPARAAKVDAEIVLDQVGRLFADPLFGNSKRCSSLLRYIVHKTLMGEDQDLSERTIGIEVFGRTPDYDTNLDPTVRVAATELRKRLALYYSQPGHEEEPRIEVPVRSYVPRLRLIEQRVTPQAETRVHEVELPMQEAQLASRSERQPLWWNALRQGYVAATLTLILLAFAGWTTYRILTPAPAITEFWAPILKARSTILLCITYVPGEDSIPSHAPISPNSMESGIALHTLIHQHVHVSMTDVSVAEDLASYLRRKGLDSSIRSAHDTTLSDLRSTPAILIGGYNNEWGSRLESNLRFTFRKESDLGKRWIEDKGDPSKRSWTVDLSAPYEQFDTDYALISRVMDPSTGQWWVGVAGLTGLGTQAAQQIVTDPQAMAALTSGFPQGWKDKNLQIVLAINVVQDSAGVPRVVATNFW